MSAIITDQLRILNCENFGKYSWGRMYDFVKTDTSQFNVINTDGVTGIATGPVIIRTRDLKEAYI